MRLLVIERSVATFALQLWDGPVSSLPTARLMAVLAHPDDESFPIGGTLALSRGFEAISRVERVARPVSGFVFIVAGPI